MLDQRKAKRFEIRLPVKILRHGSRPMVGQGETRNLSSRGVLFVSDAGLTAGERLEYVIRLPGGPGVAAAVELFCLGKVVRTEPLTEATGDSPKYSIAVTLERYEFLRPGAW